jgi:hypothetical protein
MEKSFQVGGDITPPEPHDPPSGTPAGNVDLKVKLVSGDLKVRRV